MAHHALKSEYAQLAERLNKAPLGVAPTELLYRILAMLFSEREAQLTAVLPIKPFTAAQAALIWKMTETEAMNILDGLAGRAILLDYVEPDGSKRYLLPPPMAGFFEFSLMRLRDDIDQKVLSELYYQYITQEDEFLTDLFAHADTQLGRVFVQERVLSKENQLHVLDYERATEVIKTASTIGVGLCYCRHKAAHIGHVCDAPQDICMTFNTCADSLTRHGYARRIDATECTELLHKAYAHNLVQFGENNRTGVSFICNCCGCCCEAMIAARKFGITKSIHTNFIAAINTDNCTGCGKCAMACPVEAMTMVSTNDPGHKRKQKAKLDDRVCLGCGVCVNTCTQHAITLESRPGRVITPLNSVYRTVVSAIERGKLQNLIFDNQVSFSHRAMGAILGVILRLPPIKQVLANKQIQSRYLERLFEKDRF